MWNNIDVYSVANVQYNISSVINCHFAFTALVPVDIEKWIDDWLYECFMSVTRLMTVTFAWKNRSYNVVASSVSCTNKEMVH